MTVTTRTEQVADQAGIMLVTRLWMNPTPTDRVLVIQHGLGEHAGRYDDVAADLLAMGVHVVAFDVPGHGASPGARGDLGTLAQQAERLAAVLPQLVARVGASRVVLWGHSMGAAIALTALVTPGALPPNIVGVVLTAPPVAVERTLALRVKIAVGRLLVRVAPKVALASGLDPNGISSVPSEVARYRADPLVHDRVTVEAGGSLIDDAVLLPGRASAVVPPVLLMHGLQDPICAPEGTRQLAAARPDFEVRFFEGRHELHHEAPAVRASMLGAIEGFIQRVAPPRP